ncbi:hypothetical protein C8F04DRAFT_1271496 [Mycena alexandri]|uniref:Uncharacterized protein n=1 Tax=Mycena alexandri TaxID=1745969 RepID=A0AAD6SD22_9AGAR|nr:hypothetical protein C8F04DRAFT_1271496 [Mycena alexandri]
METNPSFNLQDSNPNIYGNVDMSIGDNYTHNYYTPSPAPTTFALQQDLMQVHGRVVQLESSILPRIFAHIEQLERQVREAKEHADAAQQTFTDFIAAKGQFTEDGDWAERKADLVAAAARKAVITEIHEVTDRLIGINTRDDTGKLKKVLRAPLGPGEKDDNFDRPNWDLKLNDRTNSIFVDKVLNIVHGIVLEDQKLKEPKLGNTSKADIASMAKVYFNTLRGNWTGQTDAAAREKKELKNLQQKRAARVEDKSDDLRACLDDLEDRYGPEATAGAAEILLADYLSSEHSDCGEANKENWDAHRAKKGGGTNGLEVRDKVWRAKQVKLVYARLKTFRNARRNRLRDPTTGNKLSTAGKAPMPRFPGMKVNINNKPPPVKHARLPYASMVDPVYKAKMEAAGIAIPLLS